MADARPGDGDAAKLKRYWIAGAGREKWVNDPHPWTALYNHLKKFMPPEKAKRTASQWFHDATGHWPAERGGKNPAGKG